MSGAGSAEFRELPEEVRTRLLKAVEDRIATKMSKAESIGQSDALLHELARECKRIWAMTDESLLARAR